MKKPLLISKGLSVLICVARHLIVLYSFKVAIFIYGITRTCSIIMVFGYPDTFCFSFRPYHCQKNKSHQQEAHI